MRPELTAKQKDVLSFIKFYCEKFPQVSAPTQLEIANALKVNTTIVWQRLAALEKKGYIEWAHGYPRGIKIIKN